MIRRFWRAETGIFMSIWLLMLVGGRSSLLRDPGTLWHPVVGERLITSRQLIYTDPFSFTFAGQPWLPHQWLSECIMALLFRIDGLDTFLLVTATILAGLYTWVFHRLTKYGLHWALAALVTALTMAASSSHFHARPHLVSIVLLGWTFAALCDFEDGRIRLSRMVWLIPLYALWTNLHGGMLGGLATMILALLGWCAREPLQKKVRIGGTGFSACAVTQAGKPVPLTFVLIIFACALTAFVNPYGWRLPAVWMSIMRQPMLPQIIQEHAPLKFAKPEGWMTLSLAVLYLFVLLGTLPRWPRVTWLLPVPWFILACMSVRHTPLFAIVAALAIAEMLPHHRLMAWLVRSGSDLFQFPKEAEIRRFDWRPAILPVGLVLVAIVLQLNRVELPIVGHGWARLDPELWPVDLVGVLADSGHGKSGPIPIFNECVFGGFIIHHTCYTPGFPDYRVFVDDRCELYGERFLMEYVRAPYEYDAEAPNQDWGQGPVARIHAWESRYGSFDYALTKTGSGYDNYFANSNDWGRVRYSKAASFYRRTKPTQADQPEQN